MHKHMYLLAYAPMCVAFIQLWHLSTSDELVFAVFIIIIIFRISFIGSVRGHAGTQATTLNREPA